MSTTSPHVTRKRSVHPARRDAAGIVRRTLGVAIAGAVLMSSAGSADADDGNPDAGWTPTSLGWSVGATPDATIEVESPERSACVARGIPPAREGHVETQVRFQRRLGDGWIVAGVAWGQDNGDGWQLLMVEAPAADGGKRFFELVERRDGVWQAQSSGPTRLTPAPAGTKPTGWFEESAYMFRLEIGEDAVHGSIRDEQGRTMAELGYLLDGPAVRCGQPTLVAGSVAARFDRTTARADAPCEETSGSTGAAPSWPRTAGYVEVPGRATGFFHVEPIEGVWWMIDPEGNGYLALGTDHVHPDVHWCEELGYAPYARNVREKYDGNLEAWADATTERLRRWGFTALGVNHSPLARYRGLAHTAIVEVGRGFALRSAIVEPGDWTGFPDVFDEDWPEHCRLSARNVCARHRGDPWLLGYFLDNELEWFGENHRATGLADAVLALEPDRPARRAFAGFARDRYDTITSLNAAWRTAHGSWDAFTRATDPPPDTPASLADRAEFVRRIARRYFETATEAIREVDPDHMILGCRFAGDAPGVWAEAGAACDVVSVNFYPRVDLATGEAPRVGDRLRTWHEASGRPLMITEWSVLALDSGLPCTTGAGLRVDTQVQRAHAFEILQSTFLAEPCVVGSDFFMWVDEPASGISSTFAEDGNYGLVDVLDRPWPELTAVAARVHAQAAHIHATGTHRPLAVQPSAWSRLVPIRPDAAGARGGEVQIRRSGEAIAIGNGRLRLTRAAGSGAAFDEIAIDGILVGRLSPLIHQRAGGELWVEPDRVTPGSVEVEPLADGSFAVAMTFEKTAGGESLPRADRDGTAVQAAGRPRAFRARYRFEIAPDADRFTSRCEWVENLDRTSWELVSVFHYAMPAIGGDRAGDEPVPLPPMYYLPAAVWHDRDAEASYGVTTGSADVYELTFWIDGDGIPHPDARRPVGRRLAPGQRWDAPPGRVTVFAAAGPKAGEDWRAIAAPARGTMERPRIRLASEDWRDRLAGGLAGEMIGVVYGAPYEFKSCGRIIEEELPPYDPVRTGDALAQDDLYLEVNFLELLDEHGLDIAPDQAALAWRLPGYRLWHGNKAARENLDHGWGPPLSGSPRCTDHWQDIDLQIESDLFGLTHPGCPAGARELAARFGTVLAAGDGLYGGLFVAGLYSLAYVEGDRVRLVERASAGLPPGSAYARAIADVVAAYRTDPDDWRAAWRIVEDRWADQDVCPSGRGRPFNIDAKVNGAYVAIGLLYGEGDFWRTAEIATRCGQDADCNPSTACGVLGTMLGLRGLPTDAAAAFTELGARRFDNSNLSVDDVLALCGQLAHRAVERGGGDIDGDDLLVPAR